MAVDREKILEKFAPLRVADVCDAMDWLMLRNIVPYCYSTVIFGKYVLLTVMLKYLL